MSLPLVLTFLLAGQALADDEPTDTLTVTAGRHAAGGSVDWLTTRRLLVWRDGRLRLQDGRRIQLAELYEVQVIEGTPDPEFLRDGQMSVMLLDQTTWRLEWVVEPSQVPTDRWTLDRTPWGYSVSEPKNTPLPLKPEPFDHTYRDGFESDSAADIAAAAETAVTRGDLEAVGLMIEHLGDEREVDVVQISFTTTTTRCFETREIIQQPLGEVVAGRLSWLTRSLRSSASPQASDSAEVWRKWWAEVGQTPAADDVKPAVGVTEHLLTVRSGYREPLTVTADGDVLLAVLRRVDEEHDEHRNGIVAIPLNGESRPHQLLTVGVDDVNHEVERFETATRGDTIAMVWLEYGWDPDRRRLQFIEASSGQARGVTETDGPVQIDLDVSSPVTAITAFGDGYLLARVVRESPKGKGSVVLTRLGESGHAIGDGVSVPLDEDVETTWHNRVNAIALVEVPGGVALVLSGGADALVMLDEELRVRRSTKLGVDRPNTVQARIVRAHGKLLIAWAQQDNHGAAVFVQLLNDTGEAISKATPVGYRRSTAYAAPLVAVHGEGFAVAWEALGEPGSCRARHVGIQGELGPIVEIAAGQVDTRVASLREDRDSGQMLFAHWRTVGDEAELVVSKLVLPALVPATQPD